MSNDIENKQLSRKTIYLSFVKQLSPNELRCIIELDEPKGIIDLISNNYSENEELIAELLDFYNDDEYLIEHNLRDDLLEYFDVEKDVNRFSEEIREMTVKTDRQKAIEQLERERITN